MEQLSGAGWKKLAWRFGFQQRYLSRLAAMLHRAKIDCATSVSARGRAVKFAADLSLAMAAKGRSRWSRAIIRKYIFRINKTRYQPVVTVRSLEIRRSASAKSRRCKMTALHKKFARRLLREASRTGHNCEEEAGGAMDSCIQTLRSLIPGCRVLDTPVFLKEAAEYIVALKMQVHALQALADCYSNSNASADFSGLGITSNTEHSTSKCRI